MQSLQANLKSSLSDATAVAVLAVGSELRADDAAGLIAAEALRGRLRPNSRCRVEIFMGETAPENYTGEIKRFAPTHLLVLDAADMNKPVAGVELIDVTAIAAAMPSNTHSMPLAVLANYLGKFIQCRVLMVGIQPASRTFGGDVTPAVRAAAEKLAEIIADAIA
jgi:hydrogenase 3 maturation protease